MLSPTSQPHRILVVEQNQPICELLHLFLEQEGYETERVASLKEALTDIDEHPFDFVLMDPFALPNQPRLAQASLLKKRCYPTPVGIITGWPIPPEEAERVGFAFLVHKPFSFKQVLERIASRLNHPFTPEQQQQAQVIRRSLEALMQEIGRRCACCVRRRSAMSRSHAVSSRLNGLSSVSRPPWRMPNLSGSNSQAFRSSAALSSSTLRG